MSESVDNVSESFKQFGAIDYAVFVFMLFMCTCIGLYFGYKDHMKHKKNRLKSKRGSDAMDYLLGGKNVQVFPGEKLLIKFRLKLEANFKIILVAMSLVATFVSGITLLGTSTEIYIYGTQYAYILIGPAMMGIFMHFIVIPVFYDLKVVSMFEVR